MDYTHMKQITLASAIAIACTLPMAVDTEAAVFAKYDGIDGESKDSKHKDEIDVLSWSWGMSGDDAGREGPCVKDLVLSKNIDSATPGLARAALSGELSNMRLTVEQKQGRTYTLEFSDIGVIAVHQSQGDADDRPTEEVAFYYNKVRGFYGGDRFEVVPGGCGEDPTGGGG